MSEPAYTARISLLKLFAKSAAHVKAYIDSGRTDETLSMRIGSGAHALIFGTPRVVVYRGGTLMIDKVVKGKKGAVDTVTQVPKEYTDVRNGACWEKFKEEHADALILNDTEYAKSEAMARALQIHTDADPLLFAPGTQHERKIEWLLGGRRCSGTIDALGPRFITDLKGVVDASPRRFPFQARNMGWHTQCVWYCDGAELAGLGEREPRLVAVENTAPHNVQVYRLTDADIRDGRRQYNEWIDRLLECEASGYWPAYADGVLPLNVLNLPPQPEDSEDESEDDADSSGDEIAA